MPTEPPPVKDALRATTAPASTASSPSANVRPPHATPTGTVLHVVGVHLFLEAEDGRILLGLRHPDFCVVREAKEEAGLVLDPSDVMFAHMVHLVDSTGAQPRIQLVFRTRVWSGAPEFLEPDRCVEWRWWNPTRLPERVAPYTRAAITEILADNPYSQMGWAAQ